MNQFHVSDYRVDDIETVWQSLLVDASKISVQASISNRLDYCNLVLYGITDSILVKKAAARQRVWTDQHKHVIPIVLSICCI